MEGRRVTRKGQKYNPLFILFLCLVAAVVILLIVSIVLGARLGKTNKKLKEAEASVQQLEDTVSQLQEDLEAAKSRIPTTPAPNDGPALPGSDIAAGGSWLDLTGLDASTVKPTSLLSGYETYYTTAGVNLRSGPATSYNRITTVEFGESVQVAARESGWSFVNTGSRFGWISSDYLSTTRPTPRPRTEATSGSIT